FINTVLSWKAWVPLSKLVFVTYLIQPIIQLNYIASFRTIQEFTHLQFIVQGFGFLVISTFLGFLCNMLIESPCQMLISLTNPNNLNNFSWYESQFISAMMPDKSDVDDEMAPDPVLRRHLFVNNRDQW
ncbi:nose resistant to fluoxetine protein 6, partial [Trichonephila inaurata madagascariensis]